MEQLNILVGCEESQVVTTALLELGHNAYSCDLQDCSGSSPGRHLKMDVFKSLELMPWHLIILHPPCTKIAVSGNRWYGEGTDRHQERLDAVEWTQKLWDKSIAICDFVAMENPVGTLNRYGSFPKPTYIQPWQFGHGETKKTGFWLHGLPSLLPTDIVEGREQRIWKMPPSNSRAKERSKTYSGVAIAMASQWSGYVSNKLPATQVA